MKLQQPKNIFKNLKNSQIAIVNEQTCPNIYLINLELKKIILNVNLNIKNELSTKIKNNNIKV